MGSNSWRWAKKQGPSVFGFLWGYRIRRELTLAPTRDSSDLEGVPNGKLNNPDCNVSSSNI